MRLSLSWRSIYTKKVVESGAFVLYTEVVLISEVPTASTVYYAILYVECEHFDCSIPL